MRIVADTRKARHFMVVCRPMPTSPSRLRIPRLAAWIVAASAIAGCVRESMPDPQQAARAYAVAAARGDADALYEMLDEAGQRNLSRDDVRRMVSDQRAELADQAKSIQAPDTQVKATANVRYEDGELSSLDLQGGRFKVASADALPAGAKSPAQAIEQLRRVLARRSYAGFMRVLSRQTRSAIENDLRSLVEGLEHPEELDVDQSGETATVHVPGGHVVRLRREAGTWRIDDLD